MKTILEYPDGLHRRVPHDVYHGRHLGLVSASALARVNKTPATYKTWVDGATDEIASEAMAFGGLFHCSLLEPERFASTYVAEPEFGSLRKNDADGTTTERGKLNKQARDAWREANASKSPVAAADVSTMNAMTAAIRANPLAARMLEDGEPELTVLWTDPDTGLRCKTRTDYYVEKRRMAIDVKTADDASPTAFRRSVSNFRYHLTDALYRAGFGAIGKRIDHYVFVVVEKRPPHLVALYTLDADAIQRGHARVVGGMLTMAECLRNDSWPGYPATIQTLELPPWAA